jgi:CheY-like chemotaxis protein
MLSAGLGQCGAQVTAASSVQEALEAMAGGKFDAIISDIGMPGEDGYELIRRVRALPPEAGGKTPAIALTAYARAEDRLRSLRAGFEMHVSKPVELTELVVIIANLVRRGG